MMITYKAKRRVSPIRLDARLLAIRILIVLKTFVTEHGKILSRRTT